MIRFDTSDVERVASGLGAAADQMPFILSVALNKAALDTRQYLISDTWPTSITQRNPNFIKRALRINFSKKHDLYVEIYDDLGRAQLKRHAESGTKLPKGTNIAVPAKGVKLGAHGVPKGQRPRNLPKNKSFMRANRIYTTVGTGKNRRLKLMYILKPSVHVKKDVPFKEDFKTQMTQHLFARLPEAVMNAMRTRK